MSQRVLVLNSGSVFETGLLELLGQADDLIVADGQFDDEAAFLTAVADFKPNVVVCHTLSVDVVHVLHWLAGWPTPDRLRLLVIRMTDNTIAQYEITQVIATESADLVALVRSD